MITFVSKRSLINKVSDNVLSLGVASLKMPPDLEFLDAFS